MKINYEEARHMTSYSLQNELDKIHRNYMKVYDEYYDKGTRDSAFLKDLVDSLQGISAVLEVYIEHKGIHPSYALEKLNNSMSYIKAAISFYESKEKENATTD